MTNLARTPDPTPRSTPAYLPNYAKDADREYIGDPWSRQRPHESAKAYAAFCTYRDMDPDTRTLGKVMESHSSSVKQWSGKHRWRERAEAYDNFISAKIIAGNKRRAIEASQRQAQQARDIADIAMMPVDAFKKKVAAALEADGRTFVDDLDEVSLMKLAKAFAPDLFAAHKSERDALGSTGEVRADPSRVRITGEKVRMMLNNPALGALLEKVTIEASGELPADDGSG